jgi:hypothetical protein
LAKTDIEKKFDALEKKYQEFVTAVVSDVSKVMFKLDALEKQVAEFGINEVAAGPPPEPTHPDELPGMNDLDEFKPKGFKGDVEMVEVKDVDPEIKEKSKGLFEDGIQLTDEQLLELEASQDDEDQDDEEVLDDFYDCPACGGVAIINKSMNRCPACQNILDWSDEVV